MRFAGVMSHTNNGHEEKGVICTLQGLFFLPQAESSGGLLAKGRRVYPLKLCFHEMRGLLAAATVSNQPNKFIYEYICMYFYKHTF